MLTQDFLPMANTLQVEPLPAMAAEAIRTVLGCQLRSGGWWRSLDLSPDANDRIKYRTSEAKAGLNITTLDNGITSGCVDLLARDGSDEAREAIAYCADRMLEVQRPNGGWPQHWTGPCTPSDWPVLGASYPAEWSRTQDPVTDTVSPDQPYQHLFSVNDNVVLNAAAIMLTAHKLLGAERYLHAAIRTADFLLLAQMPEPQPGWCQQYNERMQPCWARKYEPPAVASRETQDACLWLLDIHKLTGNRKYVRAVRDSVQWLTASLRSDGKLARFYELQSNKPLYMTSDYTLTYDDSDCPTHYQFVVPSQMTEIESRLSIQAA